MQIRSAIMHRSMTFPQKTRNRTTRCCAQSLQSCPTRRTPWTVAGLGSSVYGVLQAILYFTPSLFNFPPRCNTCLSQNELGAFPITSGHLPPLWVHCITIYHFHEAKILEAVLELQAILSSFPYTLCFLKKLSKLTDFLEIFPILPLSYMTRVRPLTDYKPGS